MQQVFVNLISNAIKFTRGAPRRESRSAIA